MTGAPIRSLGLASGTWVLALSVWGSTGTAGVVHPIPRDPVRIDSGLVSGTCDGVKAYLGVPFDSMPPAGATDPETSPPRRPALHEADTAARDVWRQLLDVGVLHLGAHHVAVLLNGRGKDTERMREHSERISTS